MTSVHFSDFMAPPSEGTSFMDEPLLKCNNLPNRSLTSSKDKEWGIHPGESASRSIEAIKYPNWLFKTEHITSAYLKFVQKASFNFMCLVCILNINVLRIKKKTILNVNLQALGSFLNWRKEQNKNSIEKGIKMITYTFLKFILW